MSLKVVELGFWVESLVFDWKYLCSLWSPKQQGPFDKICLLLSPCFSLPANLLMLNAW